MNVIEHFFIGWCIASTAPSLNRRERLFVTAAAVIPDLDGLGSDLIGARGPDGYQWPIPYLLPFSKTPELVWSGQWALNAWQNFVITGIALAITFYLAWSRGYSPLDLFSRKADAVFVETLRARFPTRSV